MVQSYFPISGGYSPRYRLPMFCKLDYLNWQPCSKFLKSIHNLQYFISSLIIMSHFSHDIGPFSAGQPSSLLLMYLLSLLHRLSTSIFLYSPTRTLLPLNVQSLGLFSACHETRKSKLQLPCADSITCLLPFICLDPQYASRVY